MKKSFLCFFALFLFNFLYAEIPLQAISKNGSGIDQVLQKAMPAVVNISMQGEIPEPASPFLKREIDRIAKARNIPPGIRQFSGVGSGVIINAEEGIIVTNAHVVDMAKTIMVTLSDGRYFPAVKIGADDKVDIAVLKIKADHLAALNFGDSNRLKIGDFVAAIGSPFGLNQTVTAGIVSSLNRSGLGIEGLENFIQTDAPINPGNSGGALIDMNGNLIGINTAILSPDEGGGNIGVGFAIPSNTVKSVVEQLLKFGKVRRGVMGFFVQTVTPDIAKSMGANITSGAIVTRVLPYSPAMNAGLQVGDIITEINNKKMESFSDVVNTLGLFSLGQKVNLTIIRAGKTQTLTSVISDPDLAEKKQFEEDPFLYGLLLKNVEMDTPDLGYIEGVQIIGVKDFSPASAVGLIPGDIIVSANQMLTKTVRDLKDAVKKDKESLLLFVVHGPQSFFVVLKP